MVFSSPIFIFLFLPVFLILYLILSIPYRVKKSPNLLIILNLFLLIGSLIFYFWGETWFVLVMLASTVLDYLCGLLINYSRTKPNIQEVYSRRLAKTGVALSIIGNLTILGIFKYFNFAVDTFQGIYVNIFGAQPSAHFIEILLPIGISFYTFQSMSYTIDVYRGYVKPTRNIINFSCFVTMFPQLVAGPIIRYKDIEAQITERSITISKFSAGVQRFIVGFGKKVLIANTVAVIVDKIFAISPSNLTVGQAWLGTLFYSLQIYFDFSGYSDMAIGLGKMLGFDFLENFNYPYIAKSIREFWRRWHISLSNWFKDYLYIPLGGSRMSQKRTYLNLVIVFFLVGLWHGAAWNFVIWGLFHGIFLIIERGSFGKILDRLWAPIRHIYTLFVVMIGWVFFRADNLGYALSFLKRMIGLTGNPTSSAFEASYYINYEVILAAAIGIIGAAPVVLLGKKVYISIAEKLHAGVPRAVNFGPPLAALLFLISVFMLSAMSLASGTYNPFIYFRF
jgi:alginate O-acetyltransferase complex protein AlgI